MKSARRRSREFALQALYQWQLAGQSIADIENQYAQADGFGKADANLFSLILSGVLKHEQMLKEKLAPHLDRPWKEVSPIESAILLIGAFELMNLPETPYRVIINEAIELGKTFGGTDGHRYVNGILDKLAAIVRAHEIDSPATIAAPRAPKNADRVSVTTKVRRVIKAAE
ncbi:MAG: transcription antitermination factor NusB [Usitatibacteraceae bacterium]